MQEREEVTDASSPEAQPMASHTSGSRMYDVQERSDTPLWLSHHSATQYDRCVRVGGAHVCRRCIVLYPIAFVVAGVSLALAGPSMPVDATLLVLLPLPAVVEWWLEHLDRIRYSPLRQVILTALAGVGLGRGFARYLENPGDLLFWGVVLVYGGSCAAIAFWRWLDENAP